MFFSFFLDSQNHGSYSLLQLLLRKVVAMATIDRHDALLVIDVQNDFLPGGALGVRNGDRIIPVINRISGFFTTRVFTRDWHPSNHVSFSRNPQFLDQSWPPHCIQNTWGAQFHPDLTIGREDRIVTIGDNPLEENYSSFHNTDLAAELRHQNIRRIFIAGLATDYCVLTSAMDGRQAGFDVLVLEDAVAGVDVPPGSVARALQTMRDRGVHILSTGDLVLSKTY